MKMTVDGVSIFSPVENELRTRAKVPDQIQGNLQVWDRIRNFSATTLAIGIQ